MQISIIITVFLWKLVKLSFFFLNDLQIIKWRNFTTKNPISFWITSSTLKKQTVACFKLKVTNTSKVTKLSTLFPGSCFFVWTFYKKQTSICVCFVKSSERQISYMTFLNYFYTSNLTQCKKKSKCTKIDVILVLFCPSVFVQVYHHYKYFGNRIKKHSIWLLGMLGRELANGSKAFIFIMVMNWILGSLPFLMYKNIRVNTGSIFFEQECKLCCLFSQFGINSTSE